jgi:hypothetical protein
MTKSSSTFPQRFTKIDDLTRPDHWYLTQDDECYFFGEYTARKGFSFSATNQLSLNFKKRADLRGTGQWYWKEKAVDEIARAFRGAIQDKGLDILTFVPIPPSKARTDPLYDNRLRWMLDSIRPSRPVDVRELIEQGQSTTAAHESDTRPTPDELAGLYRITRALTTPKPQLIAIVDDLLTTGCHFRAAKTVLAPLFPGVNIIGLFVARRVPDSEIADFDALDF